MLQVTPRTHIVKEVGVCAEAVCGDRPDAGDGHSARVAEVEIGRREGRDTQGGAGGGGDEEREEEVHTGARHTDNPNGRREKPREPSRTCVTHVDECPCYSPSCTPESSSGTDESVQTATQVSEMQRTENNPIVI